MMFQQKKLQNIESVVKMVISCDDKYMEGSGGGLSYSGVRIERLKTTTKLTNHDFR
jgi:hypothetical protein